VIPENPQAFAEARAAVATLLGPPDATESTTMQPTATVARWGVRGVSLTVRAYHDSPSVVLVAERLDGDAREWRAIGDGTVRDACAWLGWTVPRATLPGLAP
jgi:hypothetical protein